MTTTDSAIVATVPRLWPGSTVVCIAGGPSLTPEDVAYVQGKARVVAVSDAYRLAPWADVLYACDPKWWVFHQGVPSFRGLKYSLDPELVNGQKVPLGARSWSPYLSDSFGVTRLMEYGEHGLSLDPTGLRHGKNSGYQAINLAVHLGAARVLLLGYDMQIGAAGQEHWFGSHPPGVRNTMAFPQWIDNFATLVEPLRQAGVEVINCTRQTALTCFPRAALAEVLS